MIHCLMLWKGFVMTIVYGLPECEFIEFLTKRLELRNYEHPQTGHWSRLGSTIGALALKLNLMTEAEVDKVLEMQDVSGEYFGELAVKADCLSHAQVIALLEIQHLHEQLQLGEQLVVDGKLDVPTLIRTLYEFHFSQIDTKSAKESEKIEA